MVQPLIGKMIVEAPYVAKYRKAGQFIILRTNEYGERVPFTIADADSAKGTITIYYQVVGKSTHSLSLLKKGDFLLDVAGPLGHPTEIKDFGTAVCIGGGIGIAPLFPISSALKDHGNRVINIIGARSEELLILEQELGPVCDELHVCTDDGTRGKKAIVTDVLKDIIEREEVNLVVAIGPVPMMRAVSNMTKEAEIKTLVSLNAIMVDGTGMCGGCRISVGDETRFTCVDGPEFDGHQVNFDELISRLGTYKNEEAQAFEKHLHKCRLDGAIDHDK